MFSLKPIAKTLLKSLLNKRNARKVVFECKEEGNVTITRILSSVEFFKATNPFEFEVEILR